MAIKVAKFKDDASGTQNGQFTVGDRDAVNSLNDLDPIYKQLIDEPVTAVVAVMATFQDSTSSGRGEPLRDNW